MAVSGARQRGSLAWVAVASVAAIGSVVAATAAGAATPPGGTVSGRSISLDDLLSGRQPTALTENVRFSAPRGARPAVTPFAGTLRLGNVRMRTITTAKKGFPSAHQLGKDASIFPNVSISLYTRRGALVPTTQDVIRNGTLKQTRSFWDVIVQPGRVWSQKGDQGWSRGSFPFALVNSIEGETHTGIALFAYRGGRVTDLRFQIVQQTAPYLIADSFSGWATAAVRYAPATKADRARDRALGARYARAIAHRYPTAPWSALRSKVGASLLAGFDEAGPRSTSVIAKAVLDGGTLYRTGCPSSAGPLPYCDGVRYGVWSVTKSAVLAIALFRLAETYGDGILDEAISTYLPQARTPSWADVTFRDLSLMASGHGATAADPTCYLCDYSRWYVARSAAEKTREALDYPRFSTPGTVYNYRDQDAYLLADAAQALLQAKQGPGATLVSLVEDEVYRPLGIEDLPINRTIDPTGPGETLGAYGYYPTVDELAKIATLIAQHGAWNGRQLLSRTLVTALLGSTTQPAGSLLSGDANESGALAYLSDFHLQPVPGAGGCTAYVPVMDGWGGNLVAPFGHGVVGIRLANELAGGQQWDSVVGMARVATALGHPACG
jgi:Beta-lactamase